MKPEGRWVRAGRFPHYRGGYQLSFWGDAQLNFLFLTEIQPTVERIRARPEFVEWYDGTKWAKHAPDFEVQTRAGDIYVDIEPDATFRKTSTSVRTASLTAELAARRIRYVCLRAKPLGAHPLGQQSQPAGHEHRSLCGRKVLSGGRGHARPRFPCLRHEVRDPDGAALQSAGLLDGRAPLVSPLPP